MAVLHEAGGIGFAPELVSRNRSSPLFVQSLTEVSNDLSSFHDQIGCTENETSDTRVSWSRDGATFAHLGFTSAPPSAVAEAVMSSYRAGGGIKGE